LEFTYDKPGMYMFHAHKNEFTNLGWMGMFNVQDKATLKATTTTTTSMLQHATAEHTTKGNDNTFSSSPFPFLQ